MNRLVRRLSDRPADLTGDLGHLLALRAGETPARPDLGLPPLPAWRPDHATRRMLQEAIAASVRAGEPRLREVEVVDGGDGDAPVFTIRARLPDGSALDAAASLQRGRLGIGS